MSAEQGGDEPPAPGAQLRGNRMLRFFDRYLGIPTVAALGAIHRKRSFDPARARRIGLMKTVAIGDTVLLTGVARDVKKQFPNSQLIAITGPDNRAVLDMVPEFDERVVISAHHPLRGAAALRAAELDVLLDFGAWPRFDAALTALSGADFTAGFSAPGQARHFAYDHVVPHSHDVHELENFRRIAASIGVSSTSAPRLDVKATAQPSGLPYVVFHPWPGGYRHSIKEWPRERWVLLAETLARRSFRIVLSGSPKDATKSAGLAALIRERGVEAADKAGAGTLLDTAVLCAGAACVVSVNTGIMHLSAAVGAPTVSLEGPTSAARWGPVGERVRSVESTLPGCGYLQLGWEYDGQRLDCMQGVSVEAVAEAVRALTAR